jgi:uncharacterized membrane protein
MSTDVTIDETCAAPLDVTFDYVADYRTIPRWMLGVRSFEPVGDKDYGLGSVFDVNLQLGVPIRTRIETVEFEQNTVIGMDSVRGFKARSRWHFEALDDARTAVHATVSYDLPCGPAGKVMGKVMEPFVRQAVSYISQHLRQNVEKLARS